MKSGAKRKCWPNLAHLPAGKCPIGCTCFYVTRCSAIMIKPYRIRFLFMNISKSRQSFTSINVLETNLLQINQSRQVTHPASAAKSPTTACHPQSQFVFSALAMSILMQQSLLCTLPQLGFVYVPASSNLRRYCCVPCLRGSVSTSPIPLQFNPAISNFRFVDGPGISLPC